MTSVVKRIEQSAHWRVTIRPVQHNAQRVPDLRGLLPILEGCSVQFRGWDFPHLDRNEPPEIGNNYVAEQVTFKDHIEYWRFYQSGQFYFIATIRSDVEQATGRQATGRRALLVLDTSYRFLEIFEFAGRLAMTPAGSDEMEIQISLTGLKDRVLWNDPESRWDLGFGVYKNQPCSAEAYSKPFRCQRTELVAGRAAMAAKAAADLFFLFGWDVGPELVGEIQSQLTNTRRR